MRPPPFEPRRRKELAEELIGRARTWLADWQPRDAGDFATGLFTIAARLESEVTQRLDQVPVRAFRSFLDWLGMTGRPGLAARLPVVFTMTPGSEPADAPARAQLQVTAGEAPVNFETVSPLRVLPGSLATIVAARPERDAFYLPPPSVVSLEAPGPVPDAWQLKSAAPALSTMLQLDPPIGLEAGLTLHEATSGQDYRIVEANGGLVTVEPPVGTIETAPGADAVAPTGLAAGTVLTRVTVFTPFSPTERNRQEHALYIGSESVFNVETEASIAVENGPADATWFYSGKRSANSPVEWLQIKNPTRQDGRVVLKKPKGAIEALEVGGHQSRWLKATLAPVPTGGPSQASNLRLSINCDLPPGSADAVTALEGVANTTPLVLDAGFYPFGREPRQFDAFYLGSKEAFSKPRAEVELQFRLGDSVGNAWAAVASSDESALVFGIGNDGRLQYQEHTLSTGSGVATPKVIFRAPTQPMGSGQRPIMLTPELRPGAASLLGFPHVTAAAGPEVWMWRRLPFGDSWTSLGVPFAGSGSVSPNVTGTILTRRSGGLVVYAISDGRLFVRSTDGEKDAPWAEALAIEDEKIRLVAPVVRSDGLAGSQDESDGVVVVTDQGAMRAGPGGGWPAVKSGPATIDDTFHPLVVKVPDDRRLCVARDSARRPVAFDLALRGIGDSLELELKGHALSFRPIDDRIVALMMAVDGSQPAAVYAWDAFEGATHVPPVAGPPTGRLLNEGPLHVLTSGVVRYFAFAGEGGEAVILPVGETAFVERAKLTDGVVLDGDAETWTGKHLVVDLTPSVKDKTAAVVKGAFRGTPPQRWLLQLTESLEPVPGTTAVRVHEALHAEARAGSVRGVRELRLKDGDNDAGKEKDLSLLVSAAGQQRIVEIKTVTVAGAMRTAELEQDVPWNVGTAIKYRVLRKGADRAAARVRPVADLSGLDAALVASLRGGLLEFPDLDPEVQAPLDVLVADRLAVLDSPWSEAPDETTYKFIARIGLFDQQPITFEPAKPRNPTLSWEYFDGTAWRLVPNLEDGTAELAKSGTVTFCVPKDLLPTDVAGRKNHWIRARLVGGDYGQETVTVTTVPGSVANSTVQTVTRSSDSIRAPFVAELTVRYELCCAVAPDFVLARDNGGFVDETSVNRTAGALVTFFVPLGEALRRAAGGDPMAGAADRAVYLGFDTPLVGGPITILFLVDEGAHDDAFPLRVDALAGGRFKPVVAKDNTRGLNESGTLEVTLAESPQLTSLFGRPQYWLRLRPGTRLADATQWEPRIRGAWVNATWAEAAETQGLEPLGSSDGSPAQRFALARPPVLENSLRLRVLERLGDEDVERLRAQGVDVQDTLPDVPKRPGCWVLWAQVADPADEGPTDRVYALDDADGTITFGDGQHGLIPPIGTNNIVAERYQTGGGERANAIKPWTAINLVTPIAGVNAVIAPEGAAGGADPQDADTTVRFAPANVRMRDRALTLADLEALTLQFSRDIAQARAVPTPDGVRLVVAIRGRQPKPGAAVRRALDAYLKLHASPSLASGDALKVVAPEVVEVRVELRLVAEAVEWSGAVATEARRRIGDLLDAATGGRERRGWPFGTLPSDTDIAAALDGAPHIEAIDRVVVTRTDGRPLRALSSLQLTALAPDGVVVEIVVEEVLA